MARLQENLKQENQVDVDQFRAAVIDWYQKNARIMPWRAPFGKKADPYHEWLSEIMLQQTVVKAVVPYFLRFINLWPTIHDLANANSEDVMREWAGLGYYARARNLHKCAKIISEEYKGIFPEDEKELQKLPGIGPYTAAAIRSIAFRKPSVVMDGNIERVLARVYAHDQPIRNTKKQIYEYASFLSEGREDFCSEYAQGLMDLGAMICTPTSAKCMICPINAFCKSYDLGLQDKIPIKKEKEKKPQKYGVLYFITNDKGELLFEKRPEKGLLGGMIGIPGSDWTEKKDIQKNQIENFQINHTFTHFRLSLNGITFNEEEINYINDKHFWYDPIDYDKLGLPTVFKKAMKQFIKIKEL